MQPERQKQLKNLEFLEKQLGLKFKDRELLREALTHDSYLNENPLVSTPSNERLEFLGDAVFGFIFAEKLYDDFPGFAEGKLTRFRSLLVRGATLARLADKLKLGEFLLLGKGEEATGGRTKPANLAAAMEALVAAIYLDSGLEAARNFALAVFKDEITVVIKAKIAIDYKSRLMHYTQAKFQQTPAYRIVDASGPPNNRCFTAEALIGDEILGEGDGSSKKEAETAAARLALKKLASLHGNAPLVD
jgi:ribonuclease-3